MTDQEIRAAALAAAIEFVKVYSSPPPAGELYLLAEQFRVYITSGEVVNGLPLD